MNERETAVEAARKAWAPVQSGLPSEGETVWITYTKRGENLVALAKRAGASWHNTLKMPVIFPVIAWQPQYKPAPFHTPEEQG